MPNESKTVGPGPKARTVTTPEGTIRAVPANWELLPPGDAGLTRRVKAAGPSWTVKEKRGRRVFSKGVWADKAVIQAEKAKLEAERNTEAYAKKQEYAAKKRSQDQKQYVGDFRAAILDFLNFHPRFSSLAEELADAVTAHSTPVGSGTVARTKRIPIEQRAESAVIAWMRHQTTAYDNMKIARIKGQRREIRRQLAARSRLLLEQYRKPGSTPIKASCPLKIALSHPKSASLQS